VPPFGNEDRGKADLMDLSIIIVNWNSIDLAKDCVASIRSTTRATEYEIILVDNASQPRACREFAASDPSLKLVCSEQNIGFARANNLGLQHARGSMILFLNPDTVVIGDAIDRMAEALVSDAGIGAVGCRLLNQDRSLQISCVQAFPTLLNQLFGVEWLQRRLPTLSWWGTTALYGPPSGEPAEVDVVSGACLMAKRSVLDEVGGFSTEYFMYAEEADLCYKIHGTGRKICYVGGAEIIHLGGQSSKEREDGFSDVVMRESVFRFLRKFRGGAYALAYRAAMLVSAAARIALLIALAPAAFITDRPVGRKTIGRSIRKWSKVASWSLSLEEWSSHLGRA
jgi:N-acetylglucosaminyl-diphospho-decaprenol L-rhamnosyltransferase